MKKLCLLLMIITLSGFSMPKTGMELSKIDIQNKAQLLKKQAPTIDINVLKLGLTAYEKAHQKGLSQSPVLTVIDYSKPSYVKRMWVFDVQHNRSLFNTWVSHGKNSGNVSATSFSNQFRSLKSSIGVFLTADTYYGGHGYALRLKGLEHGYNDHAYQRATVIHGAPYVNANIIHRYGRIGRSWGCPAVSVNLATPIINAIKNHSLVFAYYPNKTWLTHSAFLMA